MGRRGVRGEDVTGGGDGAAAPVSCAGEWWPQHTDAGAEWPEAPRDVHPRKETGEFMLLSSAH